MSRRKLKTIIPSHYILDNELCTPQQFVEKMNFYYNAIPEHQTPTSPVTFDNSSRCEEISIGQVKTAMKNINASKAVHGEDFPSWISKNCYEDLCIPVTKIVNLALQTCKYPTMFKQAEITPIAKTKSPSTAKDYRPISLLWHVGKIIESFMNRQLQRHLTSQRDDKQFAYRKLTGCTDALVCLLDDVTKTLDDSSNIGTQLILYDFSKAFDLMDHQILLQKLKSLSFPDRLISLVADYLRNRPHCVTLKTNGVRSSYKISNTGVPQGTLCGPTLWLAFVNDLKFSHGNTIKYADDTTTYYPLRKSQVTITNSTRTSVNFSPPTQGHQLVTECSDWAKQNKMRLNAQKTKTLNVSLRKSMTMTANLCLEGHVIENTASTKLLGVTLDGHLSFTEHIKEKVKSANKKIHGLLVLKQTGINPDSLVMMYRTQIIPAISHSAPAWFPFLCDYQKEELEKSQKLALRVIFHNLEHYEDRLAAANLPTLCEHLDHVCSSYVLRVTTNQDHPLQKLLKTKQKSRPKRSVSSNQSDFYISQTRTVKCGQAIFRNKKYM